MFKPTMRYQLTFEGSWPTAVTFLESSRSLVAGNQSGQIFVWELPDTPPVTESSGSSKPARKRDAPNVNPTRCLEGHSNAISRLIYDKSRKQLISASFDRSIRLWLLEAEASGEVEVVLDEQTRRDEAKRSRKDDVLSQPGLKVAKYAAAHTLQEHSDWIHSLAMSSDGKRLVSGDAAAGVVVWDLETRQPTAKWKGHPWNWIVATAFAPDGQSVLVSEFRYKRDDFDIPCAGFKLWSIDGTEKLDILKTQFPKLNPLDHSYGGGQVWRGWTKDGLVALAFSPDGKIIAAGQGGETDTGKVHLIDAQTGKLIRDVASHQYGITDVAFSRDGQLLYSAGRDTCVRVWQVSDGKEVAVIGTPRGGQFKDWISSFSLSPDEKWLAAADISGHIAVWQIAE